jgi:hypothetical protein
MEATADLAALRLPEGTRLLHIGPPKTGTTTIQAAFHAEVRALVPLGVHYAGRTRHSRRAVFAVTGRRWLGGEPPPITEWTSLVAEIRASSAPRVVLSSEAFAQADESQIRRVIDDLDAARVHVVVTLRPLASILPSSWQQSVQTGNDTAYPDWLAAQLDDDRTTSPRSFWYRHRHDLLIARWAEVVGPERITAIVLDGSDRSRVLRVFEGLTGLPAGTLVENQDLTNRSMTGPEAEAVRAFNATFWRAGLSLRLHNRVMHLGAAERMKLREPRPEWPRIETPQWAFDRAGIVAREIVAGIRASGIRVVGDLDRLADVPAGTVDAVHDGNRIPSDIAAEMALGIVFAGGLAVEDRRSPSHDLTEVPSRVMARALTRRAWTAATRPVRSMKGSKR